MPAVSADETNDAPESEARIVEKDRRRGRGARSNASGRFESLVSEVFDDGWESVADLAPFLTKVHVDSARTIISRNDSPDISFDQSINPYRGCEHGCTYCYARPSHCYLGHSAGLDFETQLYAKPEAGKLLEAEFAKAGYQPSTIALGANTDPYQPIERKLGITRQILEVLEEARHPVGIVTKSHLVTRDIDILARMAKDGLVKVAISVTTLDRKLARSMEPRASTPPKRLAALRALSEAGIPTAVMVAPVIPALNDHEIEKILEAARQAGVREAGYVMLRLPLEIKELFREWLATDFPDKAKRVIGHIKEMHGGKDYSAEFGLRQRGTGPYADLVAKRFKLALKKLGLNQKRERLRTDLFQRPVLEGSQLPLL